MEQIEIMPVRIKTAAILRKAILSGELASGQELSLTSAASMLGVSRTPVREAFQTLAAEGLIELRMNKGAIVKTIDKEFIRDHFDIRMLLEGEAVARAIQNQMDPTRLNELQQRAEEAGKAMEKNQYDQYNQTFHTEIWVATRSQKLYALLESLWNGPSYSQAVEDMDHRYISILEHRQIVSCIEKGNAEAGRKAMSKHIERSMQNVLQGFYLLSRSGGSPPAEQ